MLPSVNLGKISVSEEEAFLCSKRPNSMHQMITTWKWIDTIDTINQKLIIGGVKIVSDLIQPKQD